MRDVRQSDLSANGVLGYLCLSMCQFVWMGDKKEDRNKKKVNSFLQSL